MPAGYDATNLWNWFPAGKDRWGPVLASAASISVTHPCHHVSGTAAIGTIVPPEPSFQGSVELIADAIWTWTAAANIGIAGTTTAAGKSVKFTYDPGAAAGVGKWYPDKIA